MLVLAQANGSHERDFARSDCCVGVAPAGGHGVCLSEPRDVDLNHAISYGVALQIVGLSTRKKQRRWI